jgi:predicted adenine nucleotide alpha hydrolase (AANH) superfamily ATPase
MHRIRLRLCRDIKLSCQVWLKPNIYPIDEYTSTDEKTIRFTVKWNYKILFFVNANIVLIAGIFHAAQNPYKLTSYNL